MNIRTIKKFHNNNSSKYFILCMQINNNDHNYIETDYITIKLPGSHLSITVSMEQPSITLLQTVAFTAFKKFIGFLGSYLPWE
jgi:hypothetical protein